MHRIDTPTAQKDKFGAGKNGFTAGNPQTGTPATDLDNDYFDMLQEELAGVVEATGVNLDKSKHNQLLTALKALLLSRAHPFADIKADGPAAIAEALSNLGLGDAAKLPAPQYLKGSGYTLFKQPFFDESAVKYFATLNIAISAPALTNGQSFPVSFPAAFSADVNAVMSDTSGFINTGSPGSEGAYISDLSNTGLIIISQWQSRALGADSGLFRLIVTGVMNA
ncbi:TPA: hypothetical protein ACTVL7_001434 [Escherichia coli]|uniref:hypothetical protein n=1 Tax=Escherichia coli TaxID=562 RepID=UPI0039B4BE5E